MLHSRLSLIFATTLAAVSVSNSGFAGDMYHGHHRESAIIGGQGLPSVVPGIGTFAGSISAVRVKGNGIYFAVRGTPRTTADVQLAPKAQIIEIKTETLNSSCSYEAGVCVIRP